MEETMAAITTSIRMAEDIRDLYKTLAQATGRTPNELMVEALRAEGERKVLEIAMIQEGLSQARAGRLTPIEDVVADFKSRGMLASDFTLDADMEQAGA